MIDRETLEQLALQAACPCLYYDLADCLGETTDNELAAIVDGTVQCADCKGDMANATKS